MNVREGMARLARVTAIGYWAVVAVIAGLAYWNGLTRLTPDPNGGYGTYSKDWSLAPSAWDDAWECLWVSAIIYGVLVLMFRAIRWVAKGFADPKPQA